LYVCLVLFIAVIVATIGVSFAPAKNNGRVYSERDITTAEYQFALSIFEREFPPKDMITLTNSTGFGGKPYVRPSINGGIQINLGGIYSNPLSTQASRELFAHELTHAWQIEHYGLIWYGQQALRNQVLEGDPYDYICDAAKTLGDYNAEQQGEIVRDYYLKNACATAVARPLRSATWKLLTGSDAVDMAVSNDGRYYMVNTAGLIYTYNTAIKDWKRMPGSAGKAIAANAGKVCLVNTAGKIYELAGTAWKQMPGSAGKDIAIDADGTVWMVNTIGKIYKYNGSKWNQMPGSDAVRIAAGGGQVWMVNKVGKIYRYNGTGWTQTAGSAGWDITVSNNSKIFLTNTVGKIYQWVGSSWAQLDGSDGRIVSANNNNLVLVNKKGRMYYRAF
jgi:virginiamycin B lyase